jgi:O-acetyl-ADP-ribose deacetylase
MFKNIVAKIRPSKPEFIDRISIEYGGILAQTDCESIHFFLYPDLEWGGELNYALLKMAGPELDAYVCEHVTTPHNGEVFAVPAFNAPYKQMFLAILGEWDGGIGFEDREILNCYRHTIRMAQEMGIKSIAIPAMGRDKRDFPHIRFARVALKGINEALDARTDRVKIYCVDRRTYETYDGQMIKLQRGIA